MNRAAVFRLFSGIVIFTIGYLWLDRLWGIALFGIGVSTILHSLARLLGHRRSTQPDPRIEFRPGEGTWLVRLEKPAPSGTLAVIGAAFGESRPAAWRRVAQIPQNVLIADATEEHANELVRRLSAAGAIAVALPADRPLSGGS